MLLAIKIFTMTKNDRCKPFNTSTKKKTFLNVPLHSFSMLSNFFETVLQKASGLRALTKMVKYTRQKTAANFNVTIVKSWNQTVSNGRLNDY